MLQQADRLERLLSPRAYQPSRRAMLRGGALLVGAASVTTMFGAVPAAAQDVASDEDLLSVLNYALSLEHLENAFYRDGLASLTVEAFTALGFQPSVVDYVAQIGTDEAAHVATLTQVITDLGGSPVEEGAYNFEAALGDATAFLATAMALENTGVSAYTGAAQYLIDNDELLTAALTIHGVEARHAAYLNILNEESPFPEAFDPPLTPAEVVEIATPFITAAEVVTPNAAAEATPVP
ncbi:MAG: ferritin-like domain-containing protein [Chloroflexia bacterium]|nr:ferritin-like domain-containing protein [Chloroflexia bacterium]MDQ3411111.1 ferritin-like domain-containing protein [Chloroflexota bacterium]